MANYQNEREGQIEFFNQFRVPYEDDDSILIDHTDGVYNGNILEFKLSLSNLNRTLFQAVKYLSKMRIRGESVPATIILVDLNASTAYVYRSRDYFDDIHKVYAGAASKNNEGFTAGQYAGKYNYSDMYEASLLKKILKGRKADPDEMYLPINIDEDCIVGWAERYYREVPNANKGDFLGDSTGTSVKVIGEIRQPGHFKGLINPYTEKTNEKFKYLMDCLNDRLSKKDLGAFYTPPAYAKKAAELVQMAVDRVPEGNDYIILDRCAGTGNLESALIGLRDKKGEELIEHCVVSTYEYYEYKVLQERIGDRVRDIIPPIEGEDTYDAGRVKNADAMSREYVENPIIRQYVDDPKCTIILFENPPYRDSTANNSEGLSRKNENNNSYVSDKYRRISSTLNEGKASAREISNLFIWSGFEFYLRQDTDSYIIFSPVKYFKSVGLAKKRFIKGYLFNRKHFHATDSAIGCILWGNENDLETTKYKLDAYDIQEDENCVKEKSVVIKRVKKTLQEFYDKRSFSEDLVENKVWVVDSGYEATFQKIDTVQIYNENIIAILGAKAFAIDVKSRILVRGPGYFHHGVTFHLRSDNYKDKLPLWVAKMFPQDKWYEKDVYNTTSDGGDAYTHDSNFLKSCLIYTCLSNQNKCLTFDGSDGRHYQNELCFDGLNKTDGRIPDNTATIALRDLRKYSSDSATALDEDEKDLLNLWLKILREAEKTDGYNPDYTYGVYQITKELDTYKEEGTGRNKKRSYDNPDLHGDLDSLRVKLKAYYKSHITDKMFEYELLK